MKIKRTLVLSQARKVYGSKNQILVSMEELNELAAVLAKFPRYTDEAQAVTELYDKVLDEYADVMVVMDHVKNIFGLVDTDIEERMDAKTERLRRWLDASPTMLQTVRDRELVDRQITMFDPEGE